MSISKQKLIEAIKNIAPENLAEDWDNCGIQIDMNCGEISKILTTLEITEEIIDEAKAMGAEFIVTHHPLIFSPIRRIDNNNVVGNHIVKLIQAGLCVYAAHTSFDKVLGGNNTHLADLLGLSGVRKMELGETHSHSEFLGTMGELKEPISLKEVGKRLAETLDLSQRELRIVGRPDKAIATVGLCTGAGAEFITPAVKNGCDLFITGDVKYHQAMEASALDLCVIDAGHYGTEKTFAENFAQKLRAAVGAEVEITASKIKIDPFAYF